jgi:hypothetical protein
MARTKKGLAAVTSRGLNRKKIAKKGRGSGDRVVMKDGSTIPIQFYTAPDGFLEYEIHRFQEDGNWVIVPCLGDGCPKCDEESETISKTSYRFVAPVWNFAEKKSMILEGPKDLAEKVMFRYDQIKGNKDAGFVKRTYEAVRFPTNPVTYGLDKGEEEPIKLKASDAKDLDAYVDKQIKDYYGDELPTASSLDADDDDDNDFEDDDADTWTREDLEGKSLKALQKIAKEEGVSAKDIKAAEDKDELIDLIVGDEDDDDDDDDDDSDDDLDEMDRDELKEYIADNDLDVKVKKSMDEDDIRDAIREAEADDADDDDDDDEDDDDEDEKPRKGKKRK